MNAEEKLIHLVQKYDCLYNVKSKYYSDKHAKHDAWRRVAADMNLSVEECQKIWKKIRDSYRKSLRLRQNKSGSARLTDRLIKFEKELEYLKPFIKNKEQISNLSSPEDTEVTTDGESQSMTSPRAPSESSPSPRPRPPALRTKVSNSYRQYIEAKRAEDDPTISFFITMGRTVQRMPAGIQAKLKGEIFRLVNETEVRLADHMQATGDFNLYAADSDNAYAHCSSNMETNDKPFASVIKHETNIYAEFSG